MKKQKNSIGTERDHLLEEVKEEEKKDPGEAMVSDEIRGRGYFYCKTSFIDHLTEQLYAVAGIMDMLYLINESDLWSQRSSDEIGMVILDTKWRLQGLVEKI